MAADGGWVTVSRGAEEPAGHRGELWLTVPVSCRAVRRRGCPRRTPAATALSAWRLLCEGGRQRWHYLGDGDGDDGERRPQTALEEHSLGLDTVRGQGGGRGGGRAAGPGSRGTPG